VGEGSPRRVAVVDHDRVIRTTLEAGLRHEGFSVCSAGDGVAGLALVRAWQPDCIVLDVLLPKIDGFTLIGMLRRMTPVPIIMLTARADVKERIRALRTGADDVMAKPLDVGELAARVESALRRPLLQRDEFLRFADLELDPASRSARRGARWIALSTREFDLVHTLLRRPHRVFTRDELIELVWGVDRDVTHNTVETYISYLRAKIDAPPAPRLIHTIRGVGYALREGGAPESASALPFAAT
jgi:two-component system response regulator MprA